MPRGSNNHSDDNDDERSSSSSNNGVIKSTIKPSDSLFGESNNKPLFDLVPMDDDSSPLFRPDLSSIIYQRIPFSSHKIRSLTLINQPLKIPSSFFVLLLQIGYRNQESKRNLSITHDDERIRRPPPRPLPADASDDGARVTHRKQNLLFYFILFCQKEIFENGEECFCLLSRKEKKFKFF